MLNLFVSISLKKEKVRQIQTNPAADTVHRQTSSGKSPYLRLRRGCDFRPVTQGTEEKASAQCSSHPPHPPTTNHRSSQGVSHSLWSIYSMPQRVGHASLGNLEVLHQKANGSTIVFTHCEQDNEIKWPTLPQMAAEIHKNCPSTVLVFFNFWPSFWR